MSDLPRIFEPMFDESHAAARPLIDRICASARAENRAAAKGLVSIDDLYRLRLREDGGRDDWAMDTIEQVTAEVSPPRCGLARAWRPAG